MDAHASDNETAGAQQLTSRRRWSAIGGVLVAAVFIAVAVHAHSSRASTLLSAVTAKGDVSQLFRGSFHRREPGVEPKEYADVPIDEEAYIAGEQHVINDVFRQIGTEDAAVRTAFQDARDKMSNILEAAIEKQEEQEKTAAVDAERKKHWIKPERVDDEMRGIYKDVYHSNQLMYNFHNLDEKVGKTEDALCDGHPCKHWHELLDKTEAKAKELEKALEDQKEEAGKRAKQIRGRDHAMKQSAERAEKDYASAKEEMQHWKDLATEYHDELQQTPPPPPPPPPTIPPHCKGIVTVYGASGSVDTGGPATDLERNDCRWIIKSPSSAIVLHFPDVHAKGDEGRITIFVGPENVALYKNEDIINWASSFKSFTGDAYPAPIVCPSNEVLVVFKTDAHNAARSSMKMTWSSASATQVIAQESLAVLKDPVVTPGMQQKLVQKPVVVVNKQEIKAVPTKASMLEAKEAVKTKTSVPLSKAARKSAGASKKQTAEGIKVKPAVKAVGKTIAGKGAVHVKGAAVEKQVSLLRKEILADAVAAKGVKQTQAKIETVMRAKANAVKHLEAKQARAAAESQKK